MICYIKYNYIMYQKNKPTKANEKVSFSWAFLFSIMSHTQLTILSHFIPVSAHDNTNSVKNTL